MAETNNNNPRKSSIAILFAILFISCTSLIVINYITIRILSSTRAYVNGESQYSKGQNKASRHLTTYLYTENEKYWRLFKQEISVPLGDQTARIAMTNNLDKDIAKQGFRNGRNKEEDLDDMIWVFVNFKSIPFLKKAIGEWEHGDQLINTLYANGIELHKQISSGNIKNKDKLKYLSEIRILSDKLSINEDKFSNTFGEGTREIKNYLIVINIFFILIIISCVSIYYFITLKRILNSQKALKKNKEQLHNIILDLEKTKNDLSAEIIQHKKLIGTISHDIKSPLKFLTMTNKYIYSESENYDDVKLQKSAKSAYLSTLQLYNFTDSLLTYSKIFFEKKSSETPFYNLNDLVQQKCQLFCEISKASNNTLVNEVDKNLVINTNKEVLTVILHNIIDNAIKNTEKGLIKIYTYTENKKLYLVVKDTGKGFIADDLTYYNNLSNEQSSEKYILRNNGMGLHMVIELIHMLNGDLKISSKEQKGSKVKIITDYNH